MDTSLPTSFVPPAARGINLRVAVFSVLALALVGTPVFIVLRATLNHGIQSNGQVDVVDLKALGYFGIDASYGTIEDVPSYYRALDGHTVVLEGFMFTYESAAKTSNFQLVYNIAKCCFGGPPLAQERVFCHVPGGAVELTGAMVRVTGVMHVEIKKEAGKLSSVYTLDVEKVEER